ncbi:hypothetical protein [Paenibacillus lactis]|uniref:hypothetical protein n=1 Tax=Paenibacillus lactis TaxID=228574 RepID=UPI00048D311A|nr:hypothetical protein [Paenibacillus lactis]MCM3494722.1 hypothetical protein [Paenibacillus lactis]GIO91417.1 hypothetical protein J31TS3_26440 [Paenibacillus lactis]
MALTFWQQVSACWQSVQQDADQTAVDLAQFTSQLLLDLNMIQEGDVDMEIHSEIENDDDFWGGL